MTKNVYIAILQQKQKCLTQLILSYRRSNITSSNSQRCRKATI